MTDMYDLRQPSHYDEPIETGPTTTGESQVQPEPVKESLWGSSGYLRVLPEPVNYVSEVPESGSMYKCLSCGTEQEPCCKVCGALLVEKVKP